MKRPQLNLLIDVLSATFFVGMIATGYIIYFPLPPGSNRSLMLWNCSRHQWGEFHFWTSIGLLTLLVVHVALHWQWFVTVVARQLHIVADQRSSNVRSGVIAFLAVAAGLGAFAWLAHVSVTDRSDICCPPVGTALPDPVATASTAVPRTVHASSISFHRDVYPVLERSCLRCHGPVRAQGNFRVDQREDYFGENGGKRFVVARDSSGSELISIVSGLRTDMRMARSHKLADAEVAVLRTWIDTGADWP